MTQQEFAAGPDQSIVIYTSDDTGDEIDPTEIFTAIAEDARRQDLLGRRIVSVAVVPVRHSGAMFGRQGSGFETKVSIAVVYASQARSA